MKEGIDYFDKFEPYMNIVIVPLKMAEMYLKSGQVTQEQIDLLKHGKVVKIFSYLVVSSTLVNCI
jgi:hypothetical protein